jgi:hypothetical protein
VEGVGIEPLAGDEPDTEADLDEGGELGGRGEPPERLDAQRREPVGGERPGAGQTVGQDDDPRPGGVEVEEEQGEQR